MLKPALIVFILVNAVFQSCAHPGDDDVYYTAEIAETVAVCEDMKDNMMDFSTLSLMNGEEGTALGGEIGVVDDLEGMDVVIEMFKKLELGNELVFTTEANMCDSLEDDGAPWYPIFHNMNVTGCPVKAQSYSVEDITISLAFADDVMNHNFVGEYTMRFILAKDAKQMVCNELSLAIVEKQKEEKK